MRAQVKEADAQANQARAQADEAHLSLEKKRDKVHECKLGTPRKLHFHELQTEPSLQKCSKEHQDSPAELSSCAAPLLLVRDEIRRARNEAHHLDETRRSRNEAYQLLTIDEIRRARNEAHELRNKSHQLRNKAHQLRNEVQLMRTALGEFVTVKKPCSAA